MIKEIAKEEQEKILERVAKLMRMAKDVSSPEEAAIASKRARSLMDKYQIDEMELNLNSNKPLEAMGEQKYGEHEPSKWFQFIAVAVAKYNDCNCVLVGGFCTFRGYKSDVAVCVSMTRYLYNLVWKLCDKFIAGLKAQTGEKPGRNTADSYNKSAALTLADRFKQMMLERDEIVMSNGTSLVVVKKTAVDDFFGSVEYVTGKVNIADSLAAMQGRMDAEKINLSDQIGNELEPEVEKLRSRKIGLIKPGRYLSPHPSSRYSKLHHSTPEEDSTGVRNDCSNHPHGISS